MSPQDSKSSNGGGFNVDDLVKRIDAKIAELEEEERQEKAKLESETKNDIREEKIDNVGNNENSFIPNFENNIKDRITDDQFFDDFFSDE